MKTRTALLLTFLALLAPACTPNGDAARDDADASTTETEDDDGGPEPDLPGPDLPDEDTPEAITLERSTLEAIEGSWSGPVDPSPTGPIPFFPLNFAWEQDGSLHARTDFPGSDGYFDFRFVEVEDDRWQLIEEGKLPGGLVQTYTLDPVSQEGDITRWVYLEDPEYLAVDLTVTADTLVLDSWVRGEVHATFDLSRE